MFLWPLGGHDMWLPQLPRPSWDSVGILLSGAPCCQGLPLNTVRTACWAMVIHWWQMHLRVRINCFRFGVLFSKLKRHVDYKTTGIFIINRLKQSSYDLISLHLISAPTWTVSPIGRPVFQHAPQLPRLSMPRVPQDPCRLTPEVMTLSKCKRKLEMRNWKDSPSVDY